jgi:K+-transporting ATPase c subunit
MDWVLTGVSLLSGIIGLLLIRLHYRRGVNWMLDFAVRRERGPQETLPLAVSAAHVSHDPRYFWARPSQSARFRYDCIDCSRDDPDRNAAGGLTAIQHERITSGTLLDPYISPAAAQFQLARVAQVRGMTEDQVRSLVADATEKPLFGFLGEPRVDVLMLNIALDCARRK